MNYRTLYENGKKRLEKAGIEEAGLDARLLLEYVCNTSHSDLLAHGERELTAEEQTRYSGLMQAREKHIPLAQLTGVQEFMGLEFLVNEHVLIPRQDTEILVEEVMRSLHDGFRILDMCTGSGCILLSLLHYSNGCVGTGVDISEKALSTARENAARLHEENAHFLQSDLFDEVEGQFEIIVSNPPYIRTSVIGTLMEEVRFHEPAMALDGGEDGLHFYRRMIKEGKEHLCSGGQIFFEIGYDQGSAVEGLMRDAGFQDVTTVRDYAGNQRVVSGTKWR